jgi:hypothetical protein
MDDCGGAFVARTVFIGEKATGRIMHNPKTNELRQANTPDAAQLSNLVGKAVLLRYG